MFNASSLRCECGYPATGRTEEDLVADARRHAREDHGVDIGPEQVLALLKAQERGGVA